MTSKMNIVQASAGGGSSRSNTDDDYESEDDQYMNSRHSRARLGQRSKVF